MRPTLKLLPPLLAVAVLVALIHAQICCPEVFATVRSLVFDAYMASHPAAPQAPISIVNIDEESMSRYGPWPWQGDTLSVLIEKLSVSGAGAVALALIPMDKESCPPRQVPGNGANDPDAVPPTDAPPQMLAERLASMPSVVGFALTYQGGSELLPPRRAGLSTIGDEAPELPTRLTASLLPADGAMQGAAGIGALNVFPDPDGHVRRVPLLVQMGEELYPSFVAEVLRVAMGVTSYLVRFDPGNLEGAPLSLKIGSVVTPLDSGGEIWLHYAPQGTFPHYSADKVLAGNTPPGTFEDRVVLIGVSASGIGTRVASPLGESLTATEIHAQALGQVISGAHPVRPGWALGTEATVATTGSVLLILISLRRRGLWLIVPGILMVAAVFIGGYLLFERTLFLLDVLSPAATIAAVFVTLTLTGYWVTERERRWIQRAFSSYVSPNLVRYLMRHPDELRLKGERRVCSFVMTDLAGFTPMVESFVPEELVDLLNRYLDELIAIVFRYEGTLERIVGDAVCAHFSAPVLQPDHAQRALDCALAIDCFASSFSAKLRESGLPFGDTRVGVHTGEVIIGNFGGSNQLDYRAFGDPINTAARLESANKYFGTRVAISAATLAQCLDAKVRPVGDLLLKGKSRAITTFTPLTQAEIESGLAERYGKAYRLAEQEDEAALEAFETCADHHRDDHLTQFHLDRLRRGRSGVTIELEK